MKFNMFKNVCVLVAFLLSSLFVYGQPSDFTKVSFDVLFWGDWPEHNLKFLSLGKEKMVPLQNGLSGGMYLYEGPQKIVFYRAAKTDPATGIQTPIPLAAVTFPKKTGHYILLFRNKAEIKEEYSIYPIPVETSTFPTNSLLAINFSQFPAKLSIQGQQASLSPRGSKFFEVKTGEFRLQMATQVEEEWQLVCSTTKAIADKQRLLMVVHNNPQGAADVITFTVNNPRDTESYVDPNYKPEEQPEWMKTGIFR